jgi:hypothetical protein
MIPIVVGTLAALVIHHARSGDDEDYEPGADPTYHETLLTRWQSLDWAFAARPVVHTEIPAPVAPLPSVEPPKPPVEPPKPVLKDALRKVKL